LNEGSPVTVNEGRQETSAFDALMAADPSRPFVIAQLGQSLDGRIATISGESRYINGEAALDHLHGLRARVDAILVGAGTIAADDPQLTVRRGPDRPKPARVAIDPRGRLAPTGRWLIDDGADRIIISGEDARPCDGATIIRLPTPDGVMAPRAIVDALFARGFRKILLEGGARTLAAFIEARCVDRLHVLVAPVIIGSGKTGLDLTPIAELARALRPPTRVYPLEGGDALFDCDLTQLSCAETR
jgi:diaminohydroxyphosphoribosylaminopyrimidine deaminase/5-amino-6-(5-phosphoribosylamino)uracil reductase